MLTVQVQTQNANHSRSIKTMQLRFMGQVYSASNNRVQTVATEQTASFKGQKYQVRVPVQTIESQANTEVRKYRGVTYTVEPKVNFVSADKLQVC